MSPYEKLKSDFPCSPEVVTTAVFQEYLLKLVVLPVTFGNPELYHAVERVMGAVKDGDSQRRSEAGEIVREVHYRNEAEGLARRSAELVAFAFAENSGQKDVAACAVFEAVKCRTAQLRDLGKVHDTSLGREAAWQNVKSIAIRASFEDHDLDEGFLPDLDAGPLH